MKEEYNRKAHLQSLHQSRRAATNDKADKTILRLIKVGRAINFNSVAQESGLSKATLYNHLKLRERIEHLRQQQESEPAPGQIKRQLQDESKDAIIASLKRKIRALSEENVRLKEQTKVNYGEQYSKL